MNKNELKKVLKPLIKECIKEVMFEDGTLSSIIAEVMKGTQHAQLNQLQSNDNTNSHKRAWKPMRKPNKDLRQKEKP